MAHDRPKVLLVNDDPDTSEALRLVLEWDGHDVEWAADGREALKKLHDGLSPDVIVLDLMMPVMDGFEFRYEQLKQPGIADIPVVVCSAAMDPREAAEQLRAAGYVRLTDRVDSLRDLVRLHCRRQPDAPRA